ncbi:CpsD/CapB family tyrosine-protein kinase [Imhoffiella purpurea]|uniref:Protein-tyrosine kinase n=1 Tax=Imhoffiella purpurea TaxID=1249627 RepID=W9V6D6_9GAMM|nr:CpsD/CapB family tyrosine-protein kinase [Imhoffiella purpurea]EXJ15128.1 Protein-tyrosine kinase [Imhoffiella purpurea]
MTQFDANCRQALEQIAEIKRVLVSVEHALSGDQGKTILCTSATAGEGKSLISASLATTAAQMGNSRVILLDLNWYQPAIHGFFGLEPIHPMEKIQRTDLRDLTSRPEGYDLDVLLAPTDHGDHARTGSDLLLIGGQLIDQARDRYDLVLIDAGSIFPTNRMMMDPVMLARMVDGVALVVMKGETPRQAVKKAYMSLEIAGVDVLGVVTNQRKRSQSS